MSIMKSILRGIRDSILAIIGGFPLITLLPINLFISRLRIWYKQRQGIKPSIVHGYLPHIGMHYMSKADRLMGYSSELWSNHITPNLADGDYIDVCFDKYSRNVLFGPLTRYLAFILAIFKFDMFFYTYTSHFLWATPLQRIELPILKLTGKKILVRAYGSDVQQVDVLLSKGYQYHLFLDFHPEGGRKRDEAIRRNIRHVDKYADFVFSGNDWVDFVSRRDAIFRFPIDVSELPVNYPQETDIIRIIHATKHRHYKGSRYLENAIKELTDEGYSIEYIFVGDKSTKEAKEIYRTADIIADQFLLGIYSNFAIEGMALGKPVIGYLREEWFNINTHWKYCPIVNTSPDYIKANLIDLIEDYQLRLNLGLRGRVYVERFHNIKSVGHYMDGFYQEVWARG